MRSRRVLPVAAFVLGASSLAACGDDGPTAVQGDPLSQEEVQAVFAALSGAFSQVGVPSASPAMDGVPQPSAAPVAVDETFDFTSPCEVSGDLTAVGAVSGTVDDETYDSDLTYQLAITPSGCTVPHGGNTLTVDGNPSVAIAMDMEFTETLFAVAGSYTGGLSYSTSDGRAGSCSINLNFDISANANGGGEQSISGQVCGVAGSHFQAFTIS
ncbi:MAG: hypothetical protein HKO53_05630 [Gemmatimonadetes bacterium]|nr:hypothetical protein [Gemmatimonadota bacterium]